MANGIDKRDRSFEEKEAFLLGMDFFFFMVEGTHQGRKWSFYRTACTSSGHKTLCIKQDNGLFDTYDQAVNTAYNSW